MEKTTTHVVGETTGAIVETFMLPLLFENKKGCNQSGCTGKIEQEYGKKLTGYYEIMRYAGWMSQHSIPRFDIQPTGRYVCNVCKHAYTGTEIEKLPILPMTQNEQEASDALKQWKKNMETWSKTEQK